MKVTQAKQLPFWLLVTRSASSSAVGVNVDLRERGAHVLVRTLRSFPVGHVCRPFRMTWSHDSASITSILKLLREGCLVDQKAGKDTVVKSSNEFY